VQSQFPTIQHIRFSLFCNRPSSDLVFISIWTLNVINAIFNWAFDRIVTIAPIAERTARATPLLSIPARSQIACVLFGAIAHCVAIAAPGDLDTTFSSDGKVNLSVTSGSDQAYAMALQPDGKILLAGTCDGDSIVRFCLVRFDSDGSLDLGFGLFGGTSGRITNGEDTARAVAITPDGKIVVAGYCFSNSKYDFCLARFLPSGGLDTTFNGDGKVVTSITSQDNRAYAIAIQTDGKIVVVGSCGDGSSRDFCVARYRVDGSLDPTFDGNGKLATDIGIVDTAQAVAIQYDGKIVVAGSCSAGSVIPKPAMCVVRYTSGGNVDPGFPQRFANNSIDFSGASGVVIQPDGKILLAGSCLEDFQSESKACFYLLSSNGAENPSFIYDTYGEACAARAVALQPDGKIAVAGGGAGLTGGPFCLALFNSDGTLDRKFGNNGRTTTSILAGDNDANALAIQPDGRIIVAGTCKGTSAFDEFCVARYEAATKAYRECSLDIDGDGQVTATVDSLIHARIALGLNGNAVIGGITFPPDAKRNVWGGTGNNSIRKYLVTQCGMTLP
jgi:uncharacterized delta-60 repeat protein